MPYNNAGSSNPPQAPILQSQRDQIMRRWGTPDGRNTVRPTISVTELVEQFNRIRNAQRVCMLKTHDM